LKILDCQKLEVVRKTQSNPNAFETGAASSRREFVMLTLHKQAMSDSFQPG